ncbi:MAG: hypothetical protein RIC55_34910 [Pirellulaceae bacterium]
MHVTSRTLICRFAAIVAVVILVSPAIAQSPWSFDAGVKVRPPGSIGSGYVGTDGVKYGAGYGPAKVSVGPGGASSVGIGGCTPPIYLPLPDYPLLGVGGRICGQISTGGVKASIEPGVQYPIYVGPEYNVVLQGGYNPGAGGTPYPTDQVKYNPNYSNQPDVLGLARQQANINYGSTSYLHDAPAAQPQGQSDLSQFMQQMQAQQQAQIAAAAQRQQQLMIQLQQQQAAAAQLRQQQIQQFNDSIRQTMQPVYDATPQYGTAPQQNSSKQHAGQQAPAVTYDVSTQQQFNDAIRQTMQPVYDATPQYGAPPATQSAPATQTAPASDQPAGDSQSSGTIIFNDNAPRRTSTQSSPQLPQINRREPGSSSNTAALKLGF